MFRRNSSKQAADATPRDAVPAQSTPSGDGNGTSPKGRPTPSRRDAEAARKLRLGALPADPKAARRAEREAQRGRYEQSRQALRTGDERLYPERDRGPAKAFVRDYVDGRLRVLEVLMPLVILCWATLLLHSTKIYTYSSVGMEVVVVIGLGFGLTLTSRVKKAVRAEFGDEAVRGTGFYAFSRAVMPRPLRQPRARVTIRGVPK